jgi:hypothetical protein
MVTVTVFRIMHAMPDNAHSGKRLLSPLFRKQRLQPTKKLFSPRDGAFAMDGKTALHDYHRFTLTACD